MTSTLQSNPPPQAQECVFLNSNQASFHLRCGWGMGNSRAMQSRCLLLRRFNPGLLGKWPGAQRSSVSGTHDYSTASLLWEKSKCHLDFWFAFMVVDGSHAPTLSSSFLCCCNTTPWPWVIRGLAFPDGPPWGKSARTQAGTWRQKPWKKAPCWFPCFGTAPQGRTSHISSQSR